MRKNAEINSYAAERYAEAKTTFVESSDCKIEMDSCSQISVIINFTESEEINHERGNICTI
jgi:hypothetical protein